MRLVAVTIQKFHNFVSPQRIEVEDDVTCVVGKNESGKTTILRALHRLKPANGSDTAFDLTTEYPRWRLAPDRRMDANLKDTQPVSAEFELEDLDLEALKATFAAPLPVGTRLTAARSYQGKPSVSLSCEINLLIWAAATTADLHADDLATLQACETVADAQATAKVLAKTLKEGGDTLRAKAATSFISAIDSYASISDLQQTQCDSLWALVPSFFYFSSYNVLPGECDLNSLVTKVNASIPLLDGERTVVALLAYAGEQPADFMDSDYNSRKAELQAASVDLSRHVFEYWRQNTDLEVVFDTDNVVVTESPTGAQVPHRFLKIELRDARHGNVETNFSTRSAGFQWFFSFFAAFSEYQNSKDQIIVLLDEPGTSLHGEAQRDFVRFIFEELGSSKQTLYTTHSQHMVDPSKYEKIRAVDDRATRQNPDLGVVVTRADFSTDRDTLLPVEAALGYTIAQHLFIGSGQHLAVEGSSDFVYLQRLTEYVVSVGLSGLDARLAIIPVGGADNMPAFVALLGRRLKVSALIDGQRTGAKTARVKAAAQHNGVSESHIVVVADADSALPSNADIEDLFEVADYLRLYNWAFGTELKERDLPDTTEPILKRMAAVVGEFDHARPAHILTDRRAEFFGVISSGTVSRFEALFGVLNATIDEGSN